MTIRAGRLRHRVEILRKPTVQDDHGHFTGDRTVARTVRAQIEPLNGREFFAAEQINAETDTRIRMRFFEGLLPQDQIRHGTDLYDIKGIIDPSKKGRELVVMAARVDQ